jgi:hypothetical protein
VSFKIQHITQHYDKLDTFVKKQKWLTNKLSCYVWQFNKK